MSTIDQSGATDAAVEELLDQYSPQVRKLALELQKLVRKLGPAQFEEFDSKAKLFGYNFLPGTYKGLVLTISPQRNYVNIIFSKGVELLEVDSTGLLEGTGKLARHIKVRDDDRLRDPAVKALIKEAVARTPH